jgi:fibronectin type 3 domain-containing protein
LIAAQSNEVQSTALAAAPTGLTSLAGTTSVALKWSASAGASSYSVYQGLSAGAESAEPVSAGVTGTSYSVTGLLPGQTYYFTVAAVDAGGKSTPSNEATSTLPTSRPTGFNATAATTSIVLGWSATAGATSYNIYEGSSSGAETATAIASGLTGTGYTVTALTPGKAYFFTMVAVDGGGKSAASNEATTTVLAAAPTGPTATAGDGAVALAWTASAGAASYNVYQGSAAGSEGNSPTVSSITGTSTTISGLTNGQTYYFKVAAVDPGGVSAQSVEVSAAPVAPASTPPSAAPSGGHGGGGGLGLLDLLFGSALLVYRLRRGGNRIAERYHAILE